MIFHRFNICFYTVRPSSGEDNAIGIGVGGCDTILIQGNHVYNGPSYYSGQTGLRVGYGSTQPIVNTIITKNFIDGWPQGIYMVSDAIDGDLDIYYNIVCGHRITIQMNGGTSNGDINIFNNDFFVPNTHTSDINVNFSGSYIIGGGTTLTFKNNIVGFLADNSAGVYLRRPDTLTGSFVCNYNLYWNSSLAAPFFISGDAYHTFANWNGHGYDVNGINNTDPSFVNAGGSYLLDSDFILNVGSAAINKGVNVSLTGDYLGNPIVGLPDIGAYEYQP